MRQADLDRAVARATGETVSTIKRLGFLLADPTEQLEPDLPEHGPYVIDWDEFDSQRYDDSTGRTRSEPAAA